MTLRRIMFFKICIFCLSVAFSVGDYNTGLGRRQENEYDNYNINENYQNGHRREFQINRDYENFKSNSNSNSNSDSNSNSNIYFMTGSDSLKENINQGNREMNSNSKKNFNFNSNSNSNSDFNSNSYFNSNSNSDFNSNFGSNSDSSSYSNSNSNSDSDSNSDSSSYFNSNSNSDSTSNSNSNSYFNSKSDSNSNSDFNSNSYFNSNSNPNFNSNFGSNSDSSSYFNSNSNFGSYSDSNSNSNSNIYFMTGSDSSKGNTNRGNKEQNSNSKKNSFLQDSCGLDVPRRIIGGTSTDIDEFPWLCLLQYVDPSGEISHDCSGVLISKRYVLTAAHCTNGLGITTKNLKLRRVRLGEWDLLTDRDCQGDVCSAPLQEIEVEDIIPHEKYKPSQKSQSNDIALIRLRKEAELNQFVQPICLPFDEIGNTDYEGKKLTVSGWGRTSNARDSSSNIKMKVDLPIVNRDRCRQFYQSFFGDLRISESQFCAGGESGKDSCQGDSGGPLMTTETSENEIHWYVIGIVSSGPAACGVEDRPSLYTNVSQYMDWIMDNVKT